MASAHISALFALLGTAIGAISSFATSWITQSSQARTAQLNAERSMHSQLYGEYMVEAAKLFLRAASEDNLCLSQIVHIFAIIGRILLQSSDDIVKCADHIIDSLINVYQQAGQSPTDILAELRKTDMMRPFAEACRRELRGG